MAWIRKFRKRYVKVFAFFMYSFRPRWKLRPTREWNQIYWSMNDYSFSILKFIRDSSWIEATTGKKLPTRNFYQALKSGLPLLLSLIINGVLIIVRIGLVLCELANAIRPGVIPKINTKPINDSIALMERVCSFSNKHFMNSFSLLIAGQHQAVPASVCYSRNPINLNVSRSRSS